MKINIIGVKKVHFQTKDGNEVEGQNVFFTYADVNINGVGCDRCFLPRSKEVTVSKIPCAAHLEYNKYGKVEEIYPTE